MSICSDGSMDLTDTESSIQTLQTTLESIHASLDALITLQRKLEKKVLAIKPVYTFFTTPRRGVTDRSASNSSQKESYSDRLEEALANPATTLSVGGSAINGVDCYTYFQTHIAQTPFTQATK